MKKLAPGTLVNTAYAYDMVMFDDVDDVVTSWEGSYDSNVSYMKLLKIRDIAIVVASHNWTRLIMTSSSKLGWIDVDDLREL